MTITNNHRLVPGTHRQSHTTHDGKMLSRQYIYLSEDNWAVLYAKASELKISVSRLLEKLIAEIVANPKGNKNDSISTS